MTEREKQKRADEIMMVNAAVVKAVALAGIGICLSIITIILIQHYR